MDAQEEKPANFNRDAFKRNLVFRWCGLPALCSGIQNDHHTCRRTWEFIRTGIDVGDHRADP